MDSGSRLVQFVAQCETVRRIGRVDQFYGLVVESKGPDAFLGEICEVGNPGFHQLVQAEVVGFRDGRVLLMPYGPLSGIHVGCQVIATGKKGTVQVSEALIGRVLDGFGNPLDSKPLPDPEAEYALTPDPANPLSRERALARLDTGIKAIDVFLSLGEGQRMGIFAGSGVGKSTLLGMLARNASADINVIAMIGERGREVTDFIEDSLGESGLAKSVVVVATSDQPALVRARAALAATAIAEFFRDRGKRVMLFMDSVTRYAMAQREIGLAIGEPPTSRGYTPSTFSALPRLIERTGNFRGSGSITALYTVLVEGDDFNEPISDNLRAILDGHILLTRKLANRGQYPAIDVLGSVSRLFPKVAGTEQKELVKEALALESLYQDSREMIELGAYEPGQNPALDRAVKVSPLIQRYLSQPTDSSYPFTEALRALATLLKE